MKKKLLILIVLLFCVFVRSDAQIIELVTMLTNKVIKAIDLKIQEMQNAVIALQNTQKQAENLFSKQQLSEIALWDQKQKELFRDYYASLTQVKPALAISIRVQRIIERQKETVALFNQASNSIRDDGYLTSQEKQAFSQMALPLLNESYATIRKLNEIVQSASITSTDAGRMQLISVCETQAELQYGKMKVLMDRYSSLSQSRAKTVEEGLRVRKLYGL